MKAKLLSVVAVALMLPVGSAFAYTLSIVPPSPWPVIPPLAASSLTFTVALTGAANESILSAQVLVEVQSAGGGVAPAGLTITGGTGLGAGMIFSAYSYWDAYEELLLTSTQVGSNPDSPENHARYRALFVPTDVDGAPVPQTLTDGILCTFVLNIPAGLPLPPLVARFSDHYPIKFIGAGGTDTFISLADNTPKAPDLIVDFPEPASALLLLAAVPFLRRRSAS